MTATLTITDNPLTLEGESVQIPTGAAIADLAPRIPGIVMCQVNGLWILRADWSRPVQAGDRITYYCQPGDKGTLRTLAQVALVIAIMIYAPQLGLSKLATAAVAMAANLVGNAVINAVLPMDAQAAGGVNGQTASPAYTLALQGNQARLDQPIPEIFGYQKRYPDFAAQPYAVFDSQGDQYYHAVLCVGVGHYAIKRQLLDDTPLANFDDVLVSRILPPGTAPSSVKTNITNAAEVNGMEMLTGRYIGGDGGIVICGGRDTVSAISIDIACPALGIAQPDGSMATRTITWVVETRELDPFGVPLVGAVWTTLASEGLSAATVSPVRRTFDYTLPYPARLAIRVKRTDPKPDESNNYDDAQWVGLRGQLTAPAPLNPNATHWEVKIRASEQLSGLSQRKLALLLVRKLKKLVPSGNGYAEDTDYTETRNPADALWYKWTNTVSGDGLAPSRADAASVYAWGQVCETRQDHFDFTFDTTMSCNDADQLIARVGRAAVFTRLGVRTLARDSAVALPSPFFGPTNIVQGSWSKTNKMPTRDTRRGIVLEYFDNRSWDWESLEVPFPGELELVEPERIRLPGVSGPHQAMREALYMGAAAKYRSASLAWTTEMEGAALAYNQAVGFAPPLIGWAQSGDVVAWDAGSNTARLSEPVDTTVTGTQYISVIDQYGASTAPAAITIGADPFHVIVAGGLPAMDPSDGSRERTRYMLGTATQMQQVVRLRSLKMASRKFGAAPAYALEGLLDDPRVHTADAAWLPVAGVVQDPVDTGADGVDGFGTTGGGSSGSSGGGSGSVSHTPALYARVVENRVLNVNDRALTAGVSVTPTGVLNLVTTYDAPQAGQWISNAPIDSTVAALYEIQAQNLPVQVPVFVEVGDGGYWSYTWATPALDPASSPLDTWLPLTATRAWLYTSGVGVSGSASIRLNIRDVATQVVQASAVYTLSVIFDTGA